MGTFGQLAEDLERSVQAMASLDAGGLRVKLLKLSHDRYPGRDAAGVLPIVAVGHEGMAESDWKEFVREVGTLHYGPAQAQRMIETGVDLKEFGPASAFGRQLATVTEEGRRWYMGQFGDIMEAAERYPSLYNSIAQTMAEQTTTLRDLVSRVMRLPSPAEVGQGRYTTLGDMLGRSTVGFV